MRSSLLVKFLLLLLGVSAVALSGTIILRGLMLRDFNHYLEGESEDRVYWITADLEGAYERDSGWNTDTQAQNVLWAYTLGFDIRVIDNDGKIIIDTARAIEKASPLVKRRLEALSQSRGASDTGQYFPYSLFLRGHQIGTVEVRALQPANQGLFIRRADRFLLLSVVIVGSIALILSILFSRRLVRPIHEVAAAASAISRGDLKRRVNISRSDELGSLAEAFNRMAGDLERQELLRRKLIADVGHELRTPLGVMRGEIEGMMDGLIPNDEKRLQSLYEETGRLKRMVEGIEDLNQAEASFLSLNKQLIRVKGFLSSIVERFSLSSAEKGVSLELQCEDEPELYADPERLSQVVLNLLSNAVRATAEGGRILVTAALRGRAVQIGVEDNGSGMPEEIFGVIFERFYHGSDGGLGIGLTIVKELVEAHGGRVEVTSAVGKGSKFIVSLAADVHNSS